MPIKIGDLAVGVKLDEKQIKQSLGDIQKELKRLGDKAEREANKANSAFNKLGKGLRRFGGIIAGAFSFIAIAGFTKKLLSLGSDAEEVASKFNTVFKGVENETRTIFDGIADNVGRSRLEISKYGAEIGDVLKPLGFLTEEVARLSPEIVKLGLDLASFNNVSDDQAINALRSAITGEREALKSLGIVINETDLKQEAYNSGLAEQGAILTKQQKALATYNLLLKNSADAQGDAVRTAKGFANQVKALGGVITDTFAEAGQSVAQETAGLLWTVGDFISDYGVAILKTIVETGKTVVSIIGETISILGKLWEDRRKDTAETVSDAENSARAIGRFFIGLSGGLQVVKTAFFQVGEAIGLLIFWVIESLKFFGRTVKNEFNFVIGVISGFWETGIDLLNAFVQSGKEIFGGLVWAFTNVFSAITENLSISIERGLNKAIEVLNKGIRVINKLPGVDFDTLTGFGDANRAFKSFDLGIGETFSKVKGHFSDFVKDSKNNFDLATNAFNDFAGDQTFNTIGDQIQKFWKRAGKEWKDLSTDIQVQNLRLEARIKGSTKKQEEDYDSGYSKIDDILEKYKGSVDQAGKKAGSSAKDQKKAVKEVETAYADLEKKVGDLDKTQEKYKDNVIKFNEDIEESVRKIGGQLEDNRQKLKDTLADIAKNEQEDTEENIEGFVRGQLDKQTKAREELAKVQQDIAEQEANLSTEGDSGDRVKIREKIAELKEKESEFNQDITDSETNINELLETQGEAYANISLQLEKIIEQEKIRAWLTDVEKEEFDFKAKQEQIDAEAEAKKLQAQTEFEKENERLERLDKIYKFFRIQKTEEDAEAEELIKSDKFARLSAEEQELILKLFRERQELEAQKQVIIQQQQDIATATTELSNSTTAILVQNVGRLSSEYDKVIKKIQEAIRRQRELNALKSGGGFKSWGYTGSGGNNDVAGVVHKNEWVAPAWLIDKNQGLFNSLENMRNKGFAQGGFTGGNTEVNKSINVDNINVWERFDIDQAIGDWKFLL